jgi:hypothetical protein
MGSGYRGRVYAFRWSTDCVEVVQLLPEQQWVLEVPTKLEYKLGPGYPRYIAEVVDNDKCILRASAHGSPGGSSSAAEAAAAVAMAGASSSKMAGGILGSSPTSGFGYELMRFMQGSVQVGQGLKPLIALRFSVWGPLPFLGGHSVIAASFTKTLQGWICGCKNSSIHAMCADEGAVAMASAEGLCPS